MEKLILLKELLAENKIKCKIYDIPYLKNYKQLYIWHKNKEFSISGDLENNRIDFCDVSSNWSYIKKDVKITDIINLISLRIKEDI